MSRRLMYDVPRVCYLYYKVFEGQVEGRYPQNYRPIVPSTAGLRDCAFVNVPANVPLSSHSLILVLAGR